MTGRRLFAVLVVLALLLTPTAIGAADLDPALDAYNRGDYATAFKEWKELAEQGDAVAQSNLGQLYRDGEGVARDYALAAEWFRKSAEQGHAAAQNDLGSLYSEGRGVRKDDAEALRWYRKAADQGHSSGQFNLGLAYDYGRGVAQDPKEAMRWYRKAADQGNAWAQTNIGYFYYRGNGVSRDYAEAMRWYQKAAAQGDDVAWRNIGDLYHNGEGVTRDYGQAAAWYGKAAKEGNADAQLALAKLYEAGSGVSKDESAALLWYRKAADQGNEEAKTAAARLAKATASTATAAATPPPSDAAFSQADRKTIQQDLAALGFYDGKADGSFGPRSREAVRAFQRANNAEATGYMTVAQAASLAQQAAAKRAAAPPQPAATATTTPATTPAASAPAIAIPDDLEPIDRQFTAREPLNVRTEAKLGATIAATLAPGDSVTVLGKVHGKDWYLVGNGEAPLGYVANIELGSTHATAASVQPTPEAPAAAPATTVAATPAPYADIPFGRYHALVIGNNDYKELPKLDMAVIDARAVADLLRGQYDFDVELLIDVTRNQVMASLAAFRRRLTSDDNLVIFYSGHGYYDEAADRGYWLPVDADRDNPANWVSNADITDMIKAMQARHVLIVADSCYSGTLTRGGSIALHDAGYIRRMVEKRGRTVLTSGGLEPVLDAGGAGHSVFARAFIDALKENVDVLDGQQLFARVREPVTANAEQTPEYGAIRFAGHDGGDFIFIRRN